MRKFGLVCVGAVAAMAVASLQQPPLSAAGATTESEVNAVPLLSGKVPGSVLTYEVYDAESFARSDLMKGASVDTPFGRFGAAEFAARPVASRLAEDQAHDDVITVYSDGAISSAVPSTELPDPPLDWPKMQTSPNDDLVQAARIEGAVLDFEEEVGAGAGFPRKVFGTDNRYHTTPTTQIPYWSEVYMWNAADGTTCTGTLYRANKIVTAAHCLFNRTTGQWRNLAAYSVELAPDGGTHHYASCSGTWNAFIILGFASSGGGPEKDDGAFQIDCSYPGQIGNTQAPIVVHSANPQTYKDGLIIAGYPDYVAGVPVSGIPWGHSGRLILDTSYLKTLNVDTSSGQSGAGWYIPCQTYGWTYCDVGQHYGKASSWFSSMNVGHQVTGVDIGFLVNL